MEIANNIIYITAAAGGIGSAISEACIKKGAHVAIFDKDAERLALLDQKLKELALQTQQQNRRPNVGKVVSILADLATEAGVQAGMAEGLAAFDGRVGVLVSNLGVLVKKTFEELTPQDWRRAMDLNFFSHIWAIRAIFPSMQRAGQGHIVLMGSDQGKQPDRGLGAYAAAKAAVHSLVKTLAREFPQYGITINGIAPGMTRTPMVLQDLMVSYAQEFGTDIHEAERLEIMRRDIPLGRLGEPEEVADAVLFLIGNSFSHGSILPLDGGNARGM